MRELTILAVIVLLITNTTAVIFYKSELKNANMARQIVENDLSGIIADLQWEDERKTKLLSIIFGEPFKLKNLRMARVKVTAYTSRPEETDDTPHTTSNGDTVFPGGAAISGDIPVPFGKRMLVGEFGAFTRNDSMHSRKEKQVDIWCPDLIAANHFGVKRDVPLMWLDNDEKGEYGAAYLFD